MGLFDSVRKKEKMEEAVDQYFKLMNAYTPCFTSFEGSLYEMELTRAAVHSFATHASKLRPQVNGSNNEALQHMLAHKPNALMDTQKYIYRLATAYMVDNTVFIAPLFDEKGVIRGFYPLLKEKCEIVEYNGVKYVRYKFSDGNYGACELSKMGIMTQFQYRDELLGESNAALRPTLELMNVTNQGIISGVKNSASIRFMAKLGMTLKESDIAAERKRFTESNLGTGNNGGVLMFDQKYADVKQINSTPFTVPADQIAQIKENVFNYFGTNEAILQNRFTSAEWNAYYEGKIEPFAIEASLVHSNMVFTERELAFGNEILFLASRLQYMSNTEMLAMVTQLFDRGFITHNEGLEIMSLPPVEGGDVRYIRKEYAPTEYVEAEEGENENADA